ncbi:FadR/GntR family transcriptional regulator [Pararhizobium mangrovi]|uniref:FadR/GntR family transcriptional regulator n=1 Tax=Pararhizobium mangrovi TaxID=2590452 RepID=UPI0015E862B6|nr:FadR/GntR family transcriptional regulator [Pararhizobium mangrovi]
MAEALAERILTGDYPPGTVIPPEAELLAEFGVSRTVLREAFQVLGAKGMIRSRPRIGTTVTDPLHWNYLDREVLRWRQKVVEPRVIIGELFGLRRMIEPAAAGMAAEHIDAQALETLQHAVFAMARGNGERTPETTAADVSFHRILLMSSGNRLLSGFGAVIEEALRSSIWIGSDPANRLPVALDLHIAVFEAVRAGEGARAYEAMASLLDVTAGILESAGYPCELPAYLRGGLWPPEKS